MINQDLLVRLIFLGKKFPDYEIAEFFDIKYKYKINIVNIDTWREIASDFINEDIVYLIKGLTIAEKDFKWIGGSAGSTIWLFRLLVDRESPVQLLDDISSWVLLNSINQWSPFGTLMTLGAGNYSEYQKLAYKKSIVQNRMYSLEKEFEREADLDRERRANLRQKCASLRRTAERIQLLEKLNTMSIVEQLIFLSEQQQYAPNFFPTRLASAATIDILNSLPKENLYSILRQLKGRQKGPWCKFKRRIGSITEPIYNKKPWY